MAIKTATMRNALAAAYAAQVSGVSLHSGDPGTTGTGELTGGSPAYGRKAPNSGAAASSQVGMNPAAHDVGAGSTVAGAGLWTALTAGTFLDGTTLPSQQFTSQGTYQVALTYTQS